MRRIFIVLSTVFLVILMLVSGNLLVHNAWSETPAGVENGSTLGTAFTYQGSLIDNGQPAEGVYDFIFTLHSALEGGSPIGSSVEIHDLTVSGGLFTVELDFEQGATLYDGSAYWLEINVRPGDETGLFAKLSPRHPLTSTPYAAYAARSEWTGLFDIPAGFNDGVDDDALAGLGCVSGQIPRFNGSAWACGAEEGDISQVSPGAGLAGGGSSGNVTLALGDGYRLPQGCGNGEIPEWTGSSWRCSLDDVGTGGGGGDITGVVAGYGLEGGGLQGTVTLDVLSGTIQTRIVGMCPPGSAIQNVNQDGTVTCETDNGILYAAGTGLSLTGTTFGITDSFQLPQDCTGGQIITWNGTAWTCDDPSSGGSGWSLTGNAGTTAGTNFLGTTDDQALEIHVNNVRALLLEPTLTSPNFVAGYSGNSVGASVVGATIGGGGSDLNLNSVTADFSTVSGGQDNSAEGYGSTIDGGASNTSSGNYSTAGGGQGNDIPGNYGSISGGRQNTAAGDYAAIGGGQMNAAEGAYATLGGGQGNAVTDTFGTVGGGRNNQVNGAYGTIAGGGPADTGNPTTSNNRVLDDYGNVSGGGGNVSGSDDGVPGNAQAATVGGGMENSASAAYATSGGGYQNAVSGYGATVSGGVLNAAAANYATVTGGNNNTADAIYSTVGSGRGNTAGGAYSTIVGGMNNVVTSAFGTIAGGQNNYVGGNYGFAAGFQAQAEHQGSFVWSDSQGGGFRSTGSDQFLIDASGGVGIGTNAPIEPLTVGGDVAILGDGQLTARGVFSIPDGTDNALQKPSAIDTAGSFIFATSAATNTLTIIDVSDPDYPAYVVHSSSSLHGPVDVQVMGNLAFIASELNNSLVILDISDFSQFTSIGATNRHLGKPQAVFVTGNHAYVASYGEADTGENDGLAIFDISDPTEIIYRGSTADNLDGTSDVYVTGDYAYVASKNNDSLAIFNISDRYNNGNIETRDVFSDANLMDGPVAVQVRGGYAYVLAEEAGMLVILDIHDPDNIIYVGHQFTTLTHPASLYLSGEFVYVAFAGEPGTADHCGLAVFDISDPADIQVLSVTDMSDNQPVPERPVAITGNGHHIYVANEGHHSVSVYDVNHLETPAVTAGTLQADHLEALGDARVNHNLSVGDGLNVGPGGALIEGQLSVAGRNDSYILGRLSLGAAGFTFTGTEQIQEVYPTQQLDVHGDARFRINENHSLIISSPPEKGAFFDFTTNNFGASYTPTARIEFAVPDPFTGTTHTTEVKILTQTEADTEARDRITIGEETSIYNWSPDLDYRPTISFTRSGDVLPGVDNTYLLGNPTHRWETIYSAGGVETTSDARWKEQVTDLNYGLDEVNQLRPVSFSLKEDPDSAKHYGLIAQEVLEILPEMVDLGQEPGDPLGLNYGELTPVLVSAIQEQQEQIESQAEQIATLKERLMALESEGNSSFSGFNVLWGGALVAVALVFVGRRRWPGG